MLELYKNIKRRRLELNMSQEELALKTGYRDRSSIAKIEKGLVDLPQTKIKLFADALGTTAPELIGYEENLDTNTDFIAKMMMDRDLIEHIRVLVEMDSSDRKSVFDMIDFLAKKKGL